MWLVEVLAYSRPVKPRLPEWSTLVGRDCRDTLLSLVEPYYAGNNDKWQEITPMPMGVFRPMATRRGLWVP